MPTLGLPHDRHLEAWPTAGAVAILDLEFTCWEGSLARGWSGPDEWREIVDIGCLIVDAATFATPFGAYATLVKPQRHPRLSDYFVNLTGITQARIDAHGRSFAEALDGLVAFLRHQPLIVFNGYDGEILRENCRLADLPEPFASPRMASFRPLLAASLKLPAKSLTSSGLPALAGLPSQGRAHTALDDCRAIAAALAQWRATGAI
jgi:inhibitor of KinA sporulation pathway (predicted exonuclease)